MNFSKRQFLKQVAVAGAAALPSLARGERTETAGPRYQLGCQTLPYRAYPLSRALEGIRKAGYKHVMIFQTHQNEPAFTPALTPHARAALRRQLGDSGLELFMSFVGLGAELRTPEGLKTCIAELELCAEFGIRTVVSVGPWYYTKFPNVPKRARDWEKECDEFYAALEKVVRHAESVGVTITLKPHTGITANAKACMQVLKRLPSERLKICWDAGNVSFYEGIHPDPDLPDLAPDVKSVCIKDHLGGRAEANFPVPGTGQVDHELMFRTLFGAGFRGPIAVERIDGKDAAEKMPVELIDQRIAAARAYLQPVLDKVTRSYPVN